MLNRRIPAIVLTCALAPACDATTETPREKPATAPVALSAERPDPNALSATPPPKPAPVHRVQPLARHCPRPAVALITRPGRLSKEPYFPWVEAAFQAHPEFVLVPGTPAKPMEVRIQAYPKRQKDDSLEPRSHVLVARCADADTCNQAATMFASVVPSSEPETVCGASIPGTYGPGEKFELTSLRPVELRHLCARWVVCMRKTDTTYDPGPLCEKADKTQLACSKRETCEQVLACASRKVP